MFCMIYRQKIMMSTCAGIIIFFELLLFLNKSLNDLTFVSLYCDEVNTF